MANRLQIVSAIGCGLLATLVFGPFLLAEDTVQSRGVAPSRSDRSGNTVLDLFDGEVTLEQEPWMSRVFDTSQFTRIGLKATVSQEGGGVSCAIVWAYTEDDRFVEGPPRIYVGPYAGATGVDRNWLPYPDDLPVGPVRDRLEYPIWINPGFALAPELGLGEVAGLLARVICTPVSVSGDFGRCTIPVGGDDNGYRDTPPGSGDGRLDDCPLDPNGPLPPADADSSATLTDVKVMLRAF